MSVADGGDEGAQKTRKLISGHALVGDGIQKLMQPAMEGDFATPSDVGVGMGALKVEALSFIISPPCDVTRLAERTTERAPGCGA